MDPQGPDDILLHHIVARIEKNRQQYRQQRQDPGTYTICPFPDFLVGIDDRIQSPKLASFGPRHRGKDHLLPFEKHKDDFLSKFLSRTESLGRDSRFYAQKLIEIKDNTKTCYSAKIVMPPDDELVHMMLLDGSFMVELFREYEEEGRQVTWPWHVQTLIADLLKLENQLPFFLLEVLFNWSNIGQGASIRTLPELALRFLNQAFCWPSDMVNSQIQHPKHLLDLFRLSLLPSTKTDPPQQSKHHPLVHSIQSVKELRSTGITVRKNIAKSLLEIDFRKFQIPPLALKIPPVAIDEFTNTILVNCVALEQCLPDQSKHFTAYVCFMNCLMKQPEDVGFLRSVDIITRVSQDERYIIDLLNSLGRYVSFSVRDCYLWRQLWDIHSYYNSSWASIRRNLFSYNNIMLYCSILQVEFMFGSIRRYGVASVWLDLGEWVCESTQ
ncbi:Uncharacterized protein TCM_033486 isoform 4 [Theobroma cacao]|uniref:Uncharacterized protein isoform 4 n=1 Tax=Theobroma cacao TaxID=3641 RepID=A0A061FIC6_THECC|nr:Uncharacterized protein TCM_033486 isoform 4 [Theobroma cacao]